MQALLNKIIKIMHSEHFDVMWTPPAVLNTYLKWVCPLVRLSHNGHLKKNKNKDQFKENMNYKTFFK